jgi:ribosomal subunit interface protein
MYKKITFRSVDHSQALKEHIVQKAEKLDKFFKREPLPIDIEIVLDGHYEKHLYEAEVIIRSKNYHLIAHSQGSDMYSIIDEVINKMAREIAHKKEEMGHDIHYHA